MLARTVQIPCSGFTLTGDLVVPEGAVGLVLFAHGSGSGRLSPRNRAVARTLQHAGLATLLIDLLTEREEEIDALTRELRFDVGLLAKRLIAASRWIAEQEALAHFALGYFGASTGAAAAIVAAAELPGRAHAVVARGGRPDLAGGALARLVAPTLLIVGENDREVIELNQIALRSLRCETELVVVPGTSHLFEEPGALTTVSQLSLEWFRRHLPEPMRPMTQPQIAP